MTAAHAAASASTLVSAVSAQVAAVVTPLQVALNLLADSMEKQVFSRGKNVQAPVHCVSLVPNHFPLRSKCLPSVG